MKVSFIQTQLSNQYQLGRVPKHKISQIKYYNKFQLSQGELQLRSQGIFQISNSQQNFAQEVLEQIAKGQTSKDLIYVDLDYSLKSAYQWNVKPFEDEIARFNIDALTPNLYPYTYPIPDVDNCQEFLCHLTLRDYGHKFYQEVLGQFYGNLFQTIAKSTALQEQQVQVNLSRFDLYHAHMFVSYKDLEVGVLFHSSEYPQYDEKQFPYNLGYCQLNSTLKYQKRKMELRNLIFYQGNLAIIDLNDESQIANELINPEVALFKTIYEEHLGTPICDINYFDNLDQQKVYENVYVCY